VVRVHAEGPVDSLQSFGLAMVLGLCCGCADCLCAAWCHVDRKCDVWSVCMLKGLLILRKVLAWHRIWGGVIGFKNQGGFAALCSQLA
jgi:hypothetical protein